MKSFFLVLITIIGCSFVQAQKAKINTDLVGFKYHFYPELDGYEEYNTYYVNVKDRKGVNYMFATGNTPEAQAKDLYFGFEYLSGLRMNFNSYQLLIKVEQTSHENESKRAIEYSDKSTPNAVVTRYVYQLSASETYHVQIIDASKGNALVKEFDVKTTSTFHWPSEPNGSMGYTSSALLASNFERKMETEGGFIKKIESGFIKSAMSQSMKTTIQSSLKTQWDKISCWVSSVKTKESTQFKDLDSAEIYLKLAVDLMSDNNKAGIKGNMYVANAQANVLKAHQLYLKFSADEYVNWFTDEELKEKYLYSMKYNLYITSILTGNFELADEIYAYMEEASKTSSYAKKVLTISMAEIKRVGSWEKKFSATFKTRYGY